MNDLLPSQSSRPATWGRWRSRLRALLGSIPVAALSLASCAFGQAPFSNDGVVSNGNPVVDGGLFTQPGTGPGEQSFLVNSNNGGEPIPIFTADGMPVMQTPMTGLGRHHASTAAPYFMNDPCAGCRNQYFVQYEAMWLRREGDRNFTLSRNVLMNDYGYELEGRYTVGQRFDCLNGVDFSYAGPFDWVRTSNATSSSGGLFTTLRPANGYGLVDIDGFNNAVSQTQVLRTQLQGFEFNRRWYSWDLMSTYIGLRGFDYEEDYTFVSVNNNGKVGFLKNDVDNFLIGMHIGSDMYYPISQRLSVGGKGRFGIYANFNEGTTAIFNGADFLAGANLKDVDLSGSVEYASVVRYRILPNVVATAGYEFLYLVDVATVANQNFNPVTPASGNRVLTNDDVFFHGATAGLQVWF